MFKTWPDACLTVLMIALVATIPTIALMPAFLKLFGH